MSGLLPSFRDDVRRFSLRQQKQTLMQALNNCGDAGIEVEGKLVVAVVIVVVVRAAATSATEEHPLIMLQPGMVQRLWIPQDTGSRRTSGRNHWRSLRETFGVSITEAHQPSWPLSSASQGWVSAGRVLCVGGYLMLMNCHMNQSHPSTCGHQAHAIRRVQSFGRFLFSDS